ncbi:MAG: protein of unknown function DUF669 [Podoviridae sp. ctviO18]|nr:MAG: protein of unknown function DUF669 [Podoviridae sp. ctviO18]
MLKSDYRTPKSEFKEWKIIPEGIYQVVIEDIKPVFVKNKFNPEGEEKLNFQFVILDDGEYHGERLWRRVTPNVFDGATNNRPSYLYQILKAANKVEPTEQQKNEGLSGDELNALIGKQLVVMVKVSAPNAQGKVFSNVEGLTTAKSLLPVPKLKTSDPIELQRPEATGTEQGEEDIVGEDDIEDINGELSANSKRGRDLPF